MMENLILNIFLAVFLSIFGYGIIRLGLFMSQTQFPMDDKK